MIAPVDRLTKRADEAAAHLRQRVEVAWAAVPGINISSEGDRVILSGRGLMRRWLEDLRLRFARWSSR